MQCPAYPRSEDVLDWRLSCPGSEHPAEMAFTATKPVRQIGQSHRLRQVSLDVLNRRVHPVAAGHPFLRFGRQSEERRHQSRGHGIQFGSNGPTLLAGIQPELLRGFSQHPASQNGDGVETTLNPPHSHCPEPNPYRFSILGLLVVLSPWRY